MHFFFFVCNNVSVSDIYTLSLHDALPIFGCIYGLVALGFVLIYKATELVNFAQGDLMMLGAFTSYMFVVWYGLGYWVAFAAAVAIVALFGGALDTVVLRRVLGQPRFAVVMP